MSVPSSLGPLRSPLVTAGDVSHALFVPTRRQEVPSQALSRADLQRMQRDDGHSLWRTLPVSFTLGAVLSPAAGNWGPAASRCRSLRSAHVCSARGRIPGSVRAKSAQARSAVRRPVVRSRRSSCSTRCTVRCRSRYFSGRRTEILRSCWASSVRVVGVSGGVTVVCLTSPPSRHKMPAPRPWPSSRVRVSRIAVAR